MSETDDMVLAAVAGRRIGSTGKIRAECPMCLIREGTPDRRTSLQLDTESGWWSCYRCRAKGKVHVESLAGMASRAPQQRDVDEDAEALQPPEGWMLLGGQTAATAFMTQAYLTYLAGRGVPDNVIAEAQVGCVMRGRWAGRVLVPILSPSGEWQGWSGRAINNATIPRYRYPDGMDRGGCIWNAGALHIRTDEPAIVVEGVFDGLRHWPNAVAVLGKPAERQLPILMSAARPLVIALDGDAWRDGESLTWRLQMEGCDVYMLKLAPKTDPGDITKTDLAAQVRSCMGRL